MPSAGISDNPAVTSMATADSTMLKGFMLKSRLSTSDENEASDADQTVIDTMTSHENWGHLGKKTKVGAASSRR